MVNQDPTNPSHALFDQFVQSQTCKEVQRTFSELCHHLQLDPRDYQSFYTKLKERLNYWKAKALWIKLDKRAQHQDYQQGEVCAKNKACIYLFILIYEKRNTQEVLWSKICLYKDGGYVVVKVSTPVLWIYVGRLLSVLLILSRCIHPCRP